MRISNLFNLFGYRLPGSMSGFGLNSDKHRILSFVFVLKRSNIFKRMCRNHTVIMVSCKNKGGGIIYPDLIL